MSKKFFILLEEFSKKPTAEIGMLCKSISKLVSAKIPVPKAICVPQSTLRLISKANNLNMKVYKLIQETEFNNLTSKNKTILRLKRLITKQKIPTNLSKEFLKLYRFNLQSSFVSIQNSSLIANKNIIVENIKGEANVIDALLEVWAKSTQQAFEKLSSKTKNLDKILFPNPILIQQQIDAEISGVAYTFDERDGSTKRFTIKGLWGIINNNLDIANTYIIDSRTFATIKKNIKPQTSQFIRKLEHLKKQKLSVIKQNQTVLDDNQINKLALIISKISLSSLAQLEINWGFQNNILFIHGIKETNFAANKAEIKKNIKNIYISVTKNQDSRNLKKYADGLCIFNSGQLLSSLGNHPMHVAKSSQKKLLITAISKTIARYASIKNNLHLIYRLQDSTSKELLKLRYSTNYEIKEPNPDLGLRGTSRILAHPQVFNLELDIIKNLLQTIDNKVSLLIPFVRSPNETSTVIKLIEKNGLNKNNKLDIWLELSTPENVLNIQKYPLHKIGGFVFNTKSIYSLMLGIDPNNHDISSKYSVTTSLITAMIRNTANSLKKNSTQKSLMKKQQLLINLTNFSPGIIKAVINENIEGIIVNPKVTAIAKKCIIDKESKILYGKN